jgi:SAM-dependent methyltransferase
LEAGCGSASHFGFTPDVQLVGLDLSSAQLARNITSTGRIQGDIETCPLRSGSFDIVVCWEVLEHVPRPEVALEHLTRVLRPGGVLVLAVPHVRSLKGLATRFTPHWFHVWAYRHLFGMQHAGTPGLGPFPTYARSVLAPDRLLSFASQAGLNVVYAAAYEALKQRRLRRQVGLRGAAWQLFKRTTRTATLGRVEPEQTDLIIALAAPRV